MINQSDRIEHLNSQIATCSKRLAEGDSSRGLKEQIWVIGWSLGALRGSPERFKLNPDQKTKIEALFKAYAVIRTNIEPGNLVTETWHGVPREVIKNVIIMKFLPP